MGEALINNKLYYINQTGLLAGKPRFADQFQYHKNCAACGGSMRKPPGNPSENYEIVFSFEKFYHICCFKCHVCFKELRNESQGYCEQEDLQGKFKPVCIACKTKGSTPRDIKELPPPPGPVILPLPVTTNAKYVYEHQS